jgi:hypothetical protein
MVLLNFGVEKVEKFGFTLTIGLKQNSVGVGGIFLSRGRSKRVSCCVGY